MTENRPDRVRLSDRLEISRVLTGLWQVADIEKDGDIIDPETGADWLETYAQKGFDTFDMADHYGSAELIVGHLHKKYISKDKVQLLTKWVPPPGKISKAEIRTAVQRSLDRMQLERYRNTPPGWTMAIRRPSRP